MPSSPKSSAVAPPSFMLETEADTCRLARAFAARLGAGDVLLLNGGLAAGKTTFVRAFAAALGSPDTVSSPTYTLVHLYNAPGVALLHMDAYRIENIAEFYDLGLEDELETRISLIEWGGKLAGEFDNLFQLNLETLPDNEQARRATASAIGARAKATLPLILERFQKAMP